MDELHELKSEISRHHRDFDKISDIVDRALKEGPDSYEFALKRIRNIVG